MLVVDTAATLKEDGALGACLSTLCRMVFAASGRGAVFHCVALPAAIALVAKVPSKQATAMCVRRRRVKRSFGEGNGGFRTRAPSARAMGCFSVVSLGGGTQMLVLGWRAP